jgi:AraC family transcriptional regulator
MPVPDATSAEGLDRYSAGTRIGGSKGEAWRDIRLSIFALPPVMDVFAIPSVSEPFIAWTTSGDIEMQERENNGPWLTSRVRAGSMFLTAAGAPYDLRWKALSPEPFEAVLVILGLPLFNEALQDVFGDDAPHARLRDVSAFARSKTHNAAGAVEGGDEAPHRKRVTYPRSGAGARRSHRPRAAPHRIASNCQGSSGPRQAQAR